MNNKDKIIDLIINTFPDSDGSHIFTYPNISKSKEADICRQMRIPEQTVIYAFMGGSGCEEYTVFTESGISIKQTVSFFFWTVLETTKTFTWEEIDRVRYSADDKKFRIYMVDNTYYERNRFYMIGTYGKLSGYEAVADVLTQCANLYKSVEANIQDSMNGIIKAFQNDDADRCIELCNSLLRRLPDSSELYYQTCAQMSKALFLKIDKTCRADDIDEYDNLVKNANFYSDIAIEHVADKDCLSMCYFLKGDHESDSQIARNYFIAAMESNVFYQEALGEYRQKTAEFLSSLKSSGQSFVSRTNALKLSPLIFIVRDDLQLKGCFDPTKQIQNIFTKDAIPFGIRFEMGHPIENTLYMPHPADNSLYIPYMNASNKLFEEKVHEFSFLMQGLGARRFSYKAIKGKKISSHDIQELDANLSGGISGHSGEINYQSSNEKNCNAMGNSTFDVVKTYIPRRTPYIPEDLVWYKNDPSWQLLARQRLEGDMKQYQCKISASDILGFSDIQQEKICAGYKNIIGGINANYQTKLKQDFEKSEECIWQVIVDF